MPPIKIITHTSDAHPATGSPNATRLIIINNRLINPTNVIIIPNHAEIVSGACEKLIIPSIAYLNNFQKFQVTVNLSLAKSSSFDNLSYLVCRRHIYSLMLVCYSIMHGCSVKSATHRINGLLLTEQSVSMIIINQALMNICAI